MKLFKKLFKVLGYLLLIPFFYIITALILTSITINSNQDSNNKVHTVYLTTNGVHLDIVIPKSLLSNSLLKDLKHNTQDNYFSFGWGDEDFYINTPEWKDLKFKNAFKALFLKSNTLIHLTRYRNAQADWTVIKLSEKQLQKLNAYILGSFKTKADKKIILNGVSYFTNDNFYKANGSYSVFTTCNTWANNAFKTSNLKCCYWTPFDFGLIDKYKN